MSLNIGIVGLPNVGKSTLFSALTKSQAEAANYPFCTIEPNVGIVQVPDERLDQLETIVKPQKVIPAIVEFVDIAGLVRGASQGEGLGNQFLGHIRQVGAIAHVVRCFEDTEIIHVEGKVSPREDIETINLELCLSDLETVNKRVDNLQKYMKSQDKEVVKRAKESVPILDQLKQCLESGKLARAIGLSEDDLEVIKDLHLITLKPVVYVCNVDEDGLHEDSTLVQEVQRIAAESNSACVKISGKLESEIASLESLEEQKSFLKELGVEKSGLNILISESYNLLNLRTYFTAGEKEVRAWTFVEGAKAPQAAGIIHSDFERGFIKAEIYHCQDLFKLGSVSKVKEAGKLRIEGKEYVVKDGDVILFRFNV